MGKKETVVTYKAALDEIEQILKNIESEELDLDELTAKIKRVSELIKICKDKLRNAEHEIEKIFDEDNK